MERSTAYKKYIDEAREEAPRTRARETSSLLGGESEDEETAFNDYTNYDDDGLIVDGRADANGLDADGAPSRVVVDDSREYRLAVAVTFIATLSVFPAVTSSIESTTNALGALWSPTLFLLFNLGDLLGRHAAATFPGTPSGASLLHLALLRFAFIPLIAACNVTTPTWIVPVVFNHDVFAVVFILALAVTNGLLATVAVSHGARRVRPRVANPRASLSPPPSSPVYSSAHSSLWASCFSSPALAEDRPPRARAVSRLCDENLSSWRIED